MSASPVYRSARVYDLVMRALYGRHFGARSRAVADLIPAGCRVLDLCCGPGFLYQRHLRARGVDYTGLDLNPRFVARVVRLGARGAVADLRDDRPLPEADYVVMQAGLYHFLPDVGPVLARMRAAAGRAVVVAEPVRNLADCRVRPVAALARRLTDPGSGAAARRFTEAALDRVFEALPGGPFRGSPIPGGREKVYVLPAGAAADARGAVCEHPAAGGR